MAKKMLIDATHAEETRVVVVDGNKVEEFDFESENKRQLAGNIYLAKVTRVEPSLQAAFVDYGGNRHGFLAFSEIHPDYYQIPVADREALMEEERAYAEAMKAREEEEEAPKKRTRRRRPAKAAKVESDAEDAVLKDQISGMETIDLETDDELEGLSPMETVDETPVEDPDEAEDNDTAASGDDEGDAPDEAQSDEDTSDEGDEEDSVRDATAHDDEIESVADEDDQEDLRPIRKPRPRRYKIQEVVKVRQILLVQVVKEERGNKGAALTTYLSLAGRYCVLMPNTARGGGISRKITNAADRKKLKETASEIDLPKGAGLIVRTAGAKRTKTEIKRDYEYLQRTWEQIRELTLKSIAPAKIYEEGDLIKRSIRDLYSRDIDEVLVEGERGYRNAKDFMKMIMPSHAKNVKHYADAMPLFARYQVESYLGGMFNPTVQLKSGGYIVIGVTEALVAIDTEQAEAIVAMMVDDDENYHICELAYEFLGTKDLIVVLNATSDYAKFRELGVTVVHPATAMVNLLDHMVRSPQATQMLLGMEEGQDTIEVEVQDESLFGIYLRDIKLPSDVIVMSLRRGDQTLLPHRFEIMTLTGLDDAAQRVDTLLVASHARQPALLGPTAVAVHHDRDVMGQVRGGGILHAPSSGDRSRWLRPP